ncbi:MAG TPA: rhomboid family intramembrane serine protease [Anaerolineaceae bacterium]|nr:rhomboid family intramembrane serine protease [Anaerolineaceae bacterium]
MTDMNTQNSPDPSDWQGLPEQESPINKPEMPSQTPPNGIPEQPTSAPAEQQTVFITPQTVSPILSYLIMGLTILFFIGQQLSSYLFDADLILVFFAKVNPAIVSGELWRLVTPVLVHGGIIHIGLNMYALYILGRDVESLFGHGRFVLLYLLSAFGGNVLSFAFSEAISVGASTAIFGLIGAQAVFIGKNRKIFGNRARQMLFRIGMILLLNFAISVVPGSSIDMWGHLGGLLAGAVFSILAAPKLEIARKDGRLILADKTAKTDIFLAFLMVLLAFGVILFFAIRKAKGL